MVCSKPGLPIQKELLKRGWYLGFDGPITYKNNVKAMEVLAVTPMDKHGFFNLSCGSGVAKSILDKADVVIIEVNENLPKVSGGYSQCISVTDVDMIVEGEHGPLPEVPDLPITPAEETIAGLILEIGRAHV